MKDNFIFNTAIKMLLTALAIIIAWAINDMVGLLVLAAAILLWWLFFSDRARKKQETEQAAIDRKTMCEYIAMQLPQIITDALAGFESYLGLPSANNLSPVLTTYDVNNITCWRMCYDKLPNKPQSNRQTLTAMTSALNSAVKKALNSGIYGFPFSGGSHCTNEKYGTIPIVHVVDIRDNGIAIAIDVVCSIDDKCSAEIARRLTPPPPTLPPQRNTAPVSMPSNLPQALNTTGIMQPSPSQRNAPSQNTASAPVDNDF